jgi:hypothetical protein
MCESLNETDTATEDLIKAFEKELDANIENYWVKKGTPKD